MNIEQIFQQLDLLFTQQKLEEVEGLLLKSIKDFQASNQLFFAILLINELLGFYREKGDKKLGEFWCDEVLRLCDEVKLHDNENYGTTLLNVATAHRAFGNFQRSKEYYEKCLTVFQDKIPKNDYRYAGLYNNVSLLYAELEDYPKSIDFLEKSLEILHKLPEMDAQIATAHTSLAQMHLQLNDLAKAEKNISISLELFSKMKDFHYGAALSTAADIEFEKKNYENSVHLYEKALVELEQYLGKTENYRLLEKNLNYVKTFLEPETLNGLTLSKKYYEAFGKEMIDTHFPEYADKIAVGLVGNGSECYGFDDEFSQDHDFGAGFCLWLPDELFEKIGESLQAEYDKLPESFQGFPKSSCCEDQRTGVFPITEFYQNQLQSEIIPEEITDWIPLTDNNLASATNGEVFRDDFGLFSTLRANLQNHYPPEILKMKLAMTAHLVSQKGQYNFSRTLKRDDTLTARLILSEFITNTMELVFLLNKTYAPFYKWTFKKFQTLPLLSNLGEKFNELQSHPIESAEIPKIIEDIVAALIAELKHQQYIHSNSQENFLDTYVKEILS